jgi:hypothetical protein
MRRQKKCMSTKNVASGQHFVEKFDTGVSIIACLPALACLFGFAGLLQSFQV